MPERDGYQAGVPCWVDSSQPDPAGAAAFYGGLLGWDLEDQMPPEAPGHYFMARLRGRVVAAIGRFRRERLPRRCGRPTSGSTTPTRRQRG